MSPELRRRWRAYPTFFAALAVLTVLALAAGVALGREHAQWRRSGRALERQQRELVTLTAAANASVAGEVDALRVERDRARAELFGGAAEVDRAAGPTGRIEAFADLAAFVERNRARAAQAGVTVAAEERFGFGRFAREAPTLDAVHRIWRQRVAVERVLEVLWAAHPQALAGVWCGEDVGDATSSGRSLHVPGLVETQRVRLAFVGEAACLRRFIPGVAGLVGPVVVRELQAEPVPADPRRPAATHRTKFTLTLEVLAPGSSSADLPIGASTGAPVAATVPPWAEPRAQSAGAAWCFEVFGSPAIEYAKESREWRLANGEVAASGVEQTGVQLVEVRQLPYRWRLVGHGGEGNGEWVMLEDTRAGRTVRLRRGERDERGAITLVEWRLVRAPGGEQVAEAKLHGRDAVERWVRTGSPTLGDELVAVLRDGAAGRPVEGAEGATVRVGAIDYRIDRITEAPASAEITRLGERHQSAETLRLEPVGR